MISLSRNGRLIQLVQLSRQIVCSFDRYYYTPAFLHIDTFQNYRVNFLKENSQKKLYRKLEIKQSLKNPETNIISSDVRYLIYSAREQDLDFLISVIKRFNSQKNENDDFEFSVPLIKLMYVLNRIDKALELYLSEDNLFAFKYKVTVILINKLMEQRCYDDVLKVYDRFIEHIKKQKPEKRGFFELFSLISETLMEKNDKESLQKYQQVYNDALQIESDINQSDFIKIIVLALEQKEPEYALRLTEKLTKRLPYIANNLKILALIQLDKIEEAVSIAEATKLVFGKKKTCFFETTLEKLLDATEAKPDLYTRVKLLVAFATRDENFSLHDIREYSKYLYETRAKSASNSEETQKTNRQREFREDEFS